MKLFFAKAAFFIVTSFLLINLFAVIYAYFASGRMERDGSEVYVAIRAAQKPSTYPTVIVGDSVCHQLLLHRQIDGMLNLSTNVGVALCGQYMLARAAIDHDPALKQVILVYQPADFTVDLDHHYVFNYVVKPFYTRPVFRSQMDDLVFERLNFKPFYRLALLPMFRYSDLLSSTDYYRPRQSSFDYFSPISIDYLRKLADLCHQRGIRLKIVSSPISRTNPYDPAVFQKEMAGAHFENLFDGYTETIRRVDPAEFLDNIHFKDPFIPENSDELVKMLMKSAGGGT